MPRFSDYSLVAAFEFHYRIVNTGTRGCGGDLFVRRRRMSKHQVCANAFRIQKRLLHHHRDPTADCLAIQVRNVVSVDLDTAFRVVVKPQQEITTVDFPEPEGPSNARVLPGATRNETSWSAHVPSRCENVTRSKRFLHADPVE